MLVFQIYLLKMSARSMKRGRKHVRNSSMEAEEIDRGHKRRNHVNNDSTTDTGFQMIGAKLEEIMVRLNALEKDRVSIPSVSSEGTVMSDALSRNDNVIPQVNNPSDNASISSGPRSEITYIMRPTVDKPSFSGRDDTNPIRFLKKLKRYINAVNGQNRALEIATECLTGPALTMLELYSEEWVTLMDFEKDFQKAFWGTRQQERAKYKLVNSSWSERSNSTMSEHFAEQIDTVRLLTIPLSETDMVNSVMRHFPVDIQRLWFTKNEAVTIPAAAEFIRDIEQNVVHRTNNERMANGFNRGYDRGRGQFKRINSMNFAPVGRGHGARRGRGHRRGRFSHNYSQRYQLPAIKWQRATEEVRALETTSHQVDNPNRTNGSKASSQGNCSMSNAASAVRQ